MIFKKKHKIRESLLSPFHFMMERHKDKGKRIKALRKYKDPGLAEYIIYLSSPFRILWSNFLAGIGRGFGFVLGATVIVALTVYIVSQILVQIPVVGQFFEWINEFLLENLDAGNIPTGSHSAGGL